MEELFVWVILNSWAIFYPWLELNFIAHTNYAATLPAPARNNVSNLQGLAFTKVLPSGAKIVS